jgi:hypothetical protein
VSKLSESENEKKNLQEGETKSSESASRGQEERKTGGRISNKYREHEKNCAGMIKRACEKYSKIKAN